MNIMDALRPRTHVVYGAKKVSFWTPTDLLSETGLTLLQIAAHDLSIYQRRLDKAIATGICGRLLVSITRQRDYRRRVFLNLQKKEGGSRYEKMHAHC